MLPALGNIALGVSLLLGGVSCARPDPSPCDLVPDAPLKGTPWGQRTPERAAAYAEFYKASLRSLEGLTPEDLYTFLRQGALGGLPLSAGDPAAEALIRDRFDSSSADLAPGRWTPLDPEGTLGRFHLGPYREAGLPFEALFEAALASSTGLVRDSSELDWRVCVVRDLASSGALPLTEGDWPALVSLWQSKANPGHSLSYRHYRQPAYVVLNREDAAPLLKMLDGSSP